MYKYIKRVFALLVPALMSLATFAGAGFAGTVDLDHFDTDIDRIINDELRSVDEQLSRMFDGRISTDSVEKDERVSSDLEKTNIDKDVDSELRDTLSTDTSRSEILRQDLDEDKSIDSRESLDQDQKEVDKDFASSKRFATESNFEKGFASVMSFEKGNTRTINNEDVTSSVHVDQSSLSTDDVFSSDQHKGDFFEQLLDAMASRDVTHLDRDSLDLSLDALDDSEDSHITSDVERVDKEVSEDQRSDKNVREVN